MKFRTRIKTFLMPAIIFAFCGFVVWLAFPIFWNSLVAQKSIDTITALKNGETVSEARLRATFEAIGPIDLTNPAVGDRLVDQGILTLSLALRLPGDDPERIEFLAQAKDLAQARLRQAPADTHTWVRLAYAEYYLNGPSDLTFEAVRRSHHTGPYEFYALWPRLRLGAFLWGLLDEDLRQMTITQAEMIWRVPGERRRLVRYLFEMPEAAQAPIRAHLLNTVDDVEALQDLLEQEARRRGEPPR